MDSGSFGAVCQLKNLQELEVSGCYNISQRGLALGLRCCKSLEIFRCDSAIIEEGEAFPLLFHSLMSNNKRLSELSLSNCAVYDIHFYHVYPKSITCGVDKLVWEDFNYLLEDQTKLINNPEPNTIAETNASVEGFLRSQDSYELKRNDTVHMIPSVSTRKNPLLTNTFTVQNLTALDISYCKNLSNNGIKCLVALCPNVKKLCMRCLDQQEVNDEAILAISNGLKQLEVLDIGGCLNLTNAAFEYLGKNCVNSLLELRVFGINNKNIDFGKLCKLKKLKKLDAGNTSIVMDNLYELLRNCAFISEINISYCRCINEVLVKQIRGELERRRRRVIIIQNVTHYRKLPKKLSKSEAHSRIKDLYLKCKDMNPKKKKSSKSGSKKKGSKKKKKEEKMRFIKGGDKVCLYFRGGTCVSCAFFFSKKKKKRLKGFKRYISHFSLFQKSTGNHFFQVLSKPALYTAFSVFPTTTFITCFS